MAEITIKLCDRCGKPIDGHNIPWLIIPYQIGDDSRYRFDEMTRSLCEDCVSSLTDWLLCIDSDNKASLSALIVEKHKLETLVDEGKFDRTYDISADQLRDLLENSPNNDYISSINEEIFEEEK